MHAVQNWQKNSHKQWRELEVRPARRRADFMHSQFPPILVFVI